MKRPMDLLGDKEDSILRGLKNVDQIPKAISQIRKWMLRHDPWQACEDPEAAMANLLTLFKLRCEKYLAREVFLDFPHEGFGR